jgi:hypothetical protein
MSNYYSVPRILGGMNKVSSKNSRTLKEVDVTPTSALKSLLLETYNPCRHLGQCREARWEPNAGHIPRGYLGAIGAEEEVEVIMVFSEPGHPQRDETYDDTIEAAELMSACTSYAYQSFKHGTDLFHRNVRWFISEVYPDMTFDDQLRRVWLTEGRLCSIEIEIGRTRDKTCAENYLVRQINLLPNATVVAFGRKAEHYLKGLSVSYLYAYALAPPGANHLPARPSWEAAITEIRRRQHFRELR